MLNVDNGHIFGPAYAGTLLSKPEERLTDGVIATCLLQQVLTAGVKTFLLNSVTDSPPHEKNSSLNKRDLLQALGVDRCDTNIIKYLTQQSESHTKPSSERLEIH